MRRGALFSMTAALLLQAAGARADSPPRPSTAVSVSYFGEALTHPGVAASFDLGLLESTAFQLSFSPEVIGYIHPRNHAALIVLPRLGGRLTSPEGFFGELLLGAGWMETWVDGVVYERGTDGSVRQADPTGRARFALQGSLGLGADFRRIDGTPVAWFLRLVVLGETPVNTGWLAHVVVQSGIQLRFGETER